MNIDFDGYFRNKIESMLITTSWDHKVRERLGIQAVSQVWGERPQWYFWLHHTPGVYSLQFEIGDEVVLDGDVYAIGQFKVKCYPYRQAAEFVTFSPLEREVVSGPLFDHTCTPIFDTRHQIPDDLFLIGEVALISAPDNTLTMLDYDSQDEFRLNRNPLTKLNPENEGPAGDRYLIRSVAGWKIGYPLFECLAGMHAFHTKHAPCFMGAKSAPGFEATITSNNKITTQATNSVACLSVSLTFQSSHHKTLKAKEVWRARAEPCEKTIFEHFFKPEETSCPRNHADIRFPTNRNWWDLAATEGHSKMASLCGCLNHQGHTCWHQH
jgi:hypothetical protein